MLDFNSRTEYYICDRPTDMRKGREGLASIVRESLGHDPRDYGKAFIFYSKRYDTVKILHFDINGYAVYQKWFEDGKMLKPIFSDFVAAHSISRHNLILLLSAAVKTKIYV